MEQLLEQFKLYSLIPKQFIVCRPLQFPQEMFMWIYGIMEKPLPRT